jgi:hypothetical protein
MREILRGHPVIVALVVGCVLAGVAVGLVVLPEEWTTLRKIAGGAVAGAGCGLIIAAPRIIG